MNGLLDGGLVLVPRGGSWGDAVAERLRARGASPVIAPLIEFAPALDTESLEAAMSELAREQFDWVVFTSATAVEALGAAVISAPARVAAVGEATARALTAAGRGVDFQPVGDWSADAIVAQWPMDGVRVLLPQSDLAAPRLAEGLRARGNEVRVVTAYRNLPVAVPADLASSVRSGDFAALLVTSGSVAAQVVSQLAPVPVGTLIVCIGRSTAADALAAGLRVDLVAARQSVDAMIDALAGAARR